MPVIKDELIALFEDVRKIFYPRWDRKRQWRLDVGSDEDRALYGRSHGAAILKERIILINENQLMTQGKDYMEQLLVHEIAHAVTPGSGHGRRWRKRMEQSAQTAVNIGKKALADELLSEVKMYRDSRRPPLCTYVYGRIDEAVMDTGGKLDFDAVITSIGHEIPLHPEDILKRCIKCREVYLYAQQELEGRRKHHEKMKAYMQQV